MHAWVDRFAGSLREKGIAIDEKVLRRSFDRAAGQDLLHIITAFATDTRMVLRQRSVEKKNNEIPAAAELLKSIGMVYRHREGGVSEHDENTFFFSSLPPKVKRLSRLLRDHWKIENSQHYMLDVTFSEDASRTRVGNSLEISAAFRRMALNVLQRDTTVKHSIRGKRLRAGRDGSVLDNIYASFRGV
ncbi:hypothetical protein CA13_27600 [Planctomycetes bacterium CA13]|uniref:Transposase IS4-like domain-containing protein n=2 Tax=Novipirellula herctigrandis TaxID=2527986 RepID=A0A5C5Z1Q1_9BACT|nr:hypothetical protein CA13_27600 [Planctomycetes bacterium CA13]